MTCQLSPASAVKVGASHGPDGLAVLYTKASSPKWTSPMTLVNMDMVYHERSFRWYAAISLTMPTATFHVPKVLAERGVTGDSTPAATIDVTDGLRWSAGAEVSKITVCVTFVVLIPVLCSGVGGA